MNLVSLFFQGVAHSGRTREHVQDCFDVEVFDQVENVRDNFSLGSQVLDHNGSTPLDSAGQLGVIYGHEKE